MSDIATPRSMPARWYRIASAANGEIAVNPVEGSLESVAVRDGRLVGPHVRVETRAVIVEDAGDAGLRGRAVDPLVPRKGTLCFDPATGGIRTRENRRARGAFNGIVAEANRFGMVNAYVHADIAVQYANTLLADLGAPALPTLTVVVGAHFGSRLPGFAEGDGDFRTGELRPMSGGHYRLSARTTVVPEPFPVAPTGEIHLGPSRYRKPFAGSMSYLRNAAHNPAIVYHEFAHHLCRHTADFRCNDERRPDRQRNGKPGVEEGICDYFTAALLGSGRPYGWYRADRGSRRDVDRPRAAVRTHHDAHAIGAAWAAAFWRCRATLVDNCFLGSPVDHDRAVVATLLRIRELGRGGSRRTRSRRSAQRCDPWTVITTYIDTLADAAGARAASPALAIFERTGLVEQKGVDHAGAAPC